MGGAKLNLLFVFYLIWLTILNIFQNFQQSVSQTLAFYSLHSTQILLRTQFQFYPAPGSVSNCIEEEEYVLKCDVWFYKLLWAKVNQFSGKIHLIFALQKSFVVHHAVLVGSKALWWTHEGHLVLIGSSSNSSTAWWMILLLAPNASHNPFDLVFEISAINMVVYLHMYHENLLVTSVSLSLE